MRAIVIVCAALVACSPNPPGSEMESIVDISQPGFVTFPWSGSWSGDSPILTGDLNNDLRTDVFMWQSSSSSWVVNLANSFGTGFNSYTWPGTFVSGVPILTGDLNHDFKTDIFMWQASSNAWAVNLVNTSSTGFNTYLWPGAWVANAPVFTGDFNGDGRTDIILWRASTNSWVVNLTNISGNGFNTYEWFGAWGSDGPIHTGDLDGDGKTDIFMWRNSTKSWTVNLSTGSGFTSWEWFGAWGSDGPIFTGDLDGNHKTDVFMWRDSTKSWTVNLSVGNAFTSWEWFGGCGSEGEAVTGDFNGDGKTDVLMWRDAFKQWTVNLSRGNGFNHQQWNGAWGSDGPVLTGDFNHDGRADLITLRESDKAWYVSQGQPITPGAAATTPACGTPAWGNVGPFGLSGEYGGGGNFALCAGKIDDIQISPSWDGLGHPAMYLAANSGGGVWRSTDFPAPSPTWTPLTDHIPGLTDAQRLGILNISSVAVSAANPQTLYAAANISPPALLHSANGGTTWDLIAQGQLGTAWINRVLVDPSGVIYVASGGGIFVSEDGGATFIDRRSVTVSHLSFTDLAQYSYATNTVFVAGVDTTQVADGTNQTGIYKLAKVGGAWLFTRGTITQQDLHGQAFNIWNVTGIRMASTPNAGIAATMTVEYSLPNPGFLNIFKAIYNPDGSFTWAPQWLTNLGGSNTQGTYVQPVGIAPDGRVYGGGIGLNQSDGQGGMVAIQDTGQGWIVGLTIHVDSHVVAYASQDQKIYVGTDGGLFRFLPKPNNVPGVNLWESLNTPSLSNFLSESIGFSPAAPNDILVGHQDNGLARIVNPNSANPTWKSLAGFNESDYDTFFDPNDSTGQLAYAFDTSQQDFHKSSDGGNTFATLNWLRGRGFMMGFHPSQVGQFMVTAGLCSTGAIYGGACTTNADCCDGLSCGNGVCGGTPRQCTVLETTDGFATSSDLHPPLTNLDCPSAIAYVGAYRYIGVDGALFQGVMNGQQVVWTNVWSNNLKIVNLLADPSNPNSLYIATWDAGGIGHVYFKSNQTDNTGWSVGTGLRELTGNLPLHLGKLALMTTYARTPTLYAIDGGRNIVYRATKLNGASTTWSPFGSGLPDVNTSDLKVNSPSHAVYTSTYGRGAWSLTDYSYALEPNANGGFETGSFAGWSTAGALTYIVTTSKSGSYAAQLGSGAPSAVTSISQTFTLPPTAKTLSFWYQVHCPDTVTYDWATATLTNNVSNAVTTLLPRTCTNNGSWVFVSADVSASANNSVTLTLTNKDDNYPGDATWTLFDDLSVN